MRKSKSALEHSGSRVRKIEKRDRKREGEREGRKRVFTTTTKTSLDEVGKWNILRDTISEKFNLGIFLERKKVENPRYTSMFEDERKE